MADRRKFLESFNQEVVEELLSETSTLAQLSRRYDISSGLIVHWKKRCNVMRSAGNGAIIQGLK